MLMSQSTLAAGEQAYHKVFYQKAQKFAELNRFHMNNLPLSLRNQCYLAATIKTSVSADGKPVLTEVIQSSGVPRLDEYFQYVIRQAAPYPRLDEFISPSTDSVALESIFILDLRHYDESRRSGGPCSEFQSRRLLGEYTI
jgi:hypothetical protein